MVNRRLLIVAFAVIPFVLAACIPSLNTGGGKPKSEEFLAGAIVRGFPTNMPLYKNAQIVESYGGASGYGASYISDDGLAKVVNFYNQSLSELGWTTTSRQVSETNYAFDIKNEKSIGQVIVNIATDGKKTAITMSVGAR